MQMHDLAQISGGGKYCAMQSGPYPLPQLEGLCFLFILPSGFDGEKCTSSWVQLRGPPI